MKRFVVAKINFFDNDLNQRIKEYEDLATAYETELKNDELLWDDETFSTVEEAKQRYFDTDMMISIVEI